MCWQRATRGNTPVLTLLVSLWLWPFQLCPRVGGWPSSTPPPPKQQQHETELRGWLQGVPGPRLRLRQVRLLLLRDVPEQGGGAYVCICMHACTHNHTPPHISTDHPITDPRRPTPSRPPPPSPWPSSWPSSRSSCSPSATPSGAWFVCLALCPAFVSLKKKQTNRERLAHLSTYDNRPPNPPLIKAPR